MAGGQKQLKQRIVAVGNVKKITKAMQMIASSKMKGAERRMQHARSFSNDVLTVWPEESAKDQPNILPTGRTLVLPVTSDRGLCGSLNTGVTRVVKREVEAGLKDGKDIGLLVVGEKGRAHLERQFFPQFTFVATDAGKSKSVTFAETSVIAEALIAQKFDAVKIYHNRFVNSLTYSMVVATIPSLDKLLENRDAWNSFDIEGNSDDVLENLYEYRLGVAMFYYLSENACAEMSSRVNSMSNSSKNAGELIDKLLLLYNRNRQQQVTTELLEVISGAVAAEEQVKQN